MSVQFLNTIFSNPIILSSSPLTETANRIREGELHGAGGAILKTSCFYSRKKDYDTRKVIFSSDYSCYYAYSSFEREILTAEEGLTLYRDASKTCSFPIIPSVTALSLNPEDWLPLCLAFQGEGAAIIQLDFFYLGTFLGQPHFADQFYQLLDTLVHSLSCQIMPKVNIDLPADFIFGLISKAGVKGVSLLDSVRVPVTGTSKDLQLPFSSTSCFGSWQLPLSLHYAYIASQYGLEICGGGGITDCSSVMRMLSCNATLVQVASTVLLNGYEIIQELLPVKEHTVILSPSSGISYQINKDKCTRCYTCTKSSGWCDAISIDNDGFPFIRKELCENCGWCVARCPAGCLSKSMAIRE